MRLEPARRASPGCCTSKQHLIERIFHGSVYLTELELRHEQVAQLVAVHFERLQDADVELPALEVVLEALEDDVHGPVRVEVELP